MSSPTMAMDFANGRQEVAVDQEGNHLDEHGFPDIPSATDAESNPDQFNAISRAALTPDAPEDFTITGPPDGRVQLVAGFIADGLRFTDGEVRELRGRDEELLARALATGDMTRYLDAIVRAGTSRLGEVEDAKELGKALDSLLIGDRDLIIMQVRRSTYGDVVKLDVVCPLCDAEFKIDYSLANDVPIRGFAAGDDPAQRVFDLELPKGGACTLRLVDGAAQKKVYSPENLARTSAELNTYLLTEVIETLNGRPVKGVGPVLDMHAADRRAVLDWLIDNAPGPRYQDVKQECPECVREFPLVVSVREMFRGD